MTTARLPSPLRPLVWDRDRWSAAGEDRSASVERGPSDAAPVARRKARYRPGAVEEAQRTWSTWALGAGLSGGIGEQATKAAVEYLQLGLSAEVVAALVLIRAQRGGAVDRELIERESAHLGRCLEDLPPLVSAGVLTARASGALELEYTRRLNALVESQTPLAVEHAPAQVAGTQEVTAVAETHVEATHTTQPPAVTPVAKLEPAGPPFSLRALFAEHSVLILASLGAFLLVVATVLFELYGTIGLGGAARLGAVVALAIMFAVAGLLARRRRGLESVGQIYIALAAVLLPLVGLAAWTFLDLGANGLTVYQALAVTAAACAVAYGVLAHRLALRAYGAMTGLAIFVTLVGASGWVGGDYWLAAGLALTPAVYALWQRVLTSDSFEDFQWFAHASAVVALGDAVRHQPDGWLWTVTLAAGALAYLAWNALAPRPVRAWIGEGGVIAAAAAASIPLGLTSYQFALPFATAVPLVLLSRAAGGLGSTIRTFRPHTAHLYAAVAAGLVLAIAESINLNHLWPLAAALAIAFVLYAGDHALEPTVLSGAALRAALLLALAAGGRAAGFGPWTAAVTALGLVAFTGTFANARLSRLTAHASLFYYGGLIIVGGELYDGSLGTGQWAATVALALSALALGAAAEMGAVRFSALAARAVFSLAWFSGVDALGAEAWRGPFDALLAPFYVALAQVRALVRHSTATAGRRWLVHAAAIAAVALCFTGPADQLWWRLTAAGAALTLAYWWSAIVRIERELPWVAWAAASATAASLAVAVVPFEWLGATIAGAAVLLTGAWVLLRGRLPRERLEEPGILVLTITVAFGEGVAAFQGWPQWSQAMAGLLGGAAFFAWSRIETSPLRQGWSPVERCIASGLCLVGLGFASAALQLDTALFGVGALAVTSLHAEWHARTAQRIERWYAIGIALLMAPAIFVWPYTNEAPIVVAAELTALAIVVTRTAIRGREWWLAGPAVLVLAPALAFALAGAGIRDRQATETAFATLAWLGGLAATAVRIRFGSRWALSIGAGALAIAATTLIAILGNHDNDVAGIALISYAPLIYAMALQERNRPALAVAPASALIGVSVLLYTHNADTIYYAAVIGVGGLVFWMLGLAVFRWIGRGPLVDWHRYIGLGLLVAACAAGFGFPDRTGRASLGAVLATVACVITGATLYFDARAYGWRPNLYVAIVAASTGAFFAARFVNLESWELAGPGLGLIITGITIRRARGFSVDVWLRRLIVATGIGLVMGWAVALAVTGDIWWLVVLLVEGAMAVAAGISVRSRVLLAGGGAALALASLRALLLIAQAGYLFVAFGIVALALLVIATGLALGRERYFSTNRRDGHDQVAGWD